MIDLAALRKDPEAVRSLLARRGPVPNDFERLLAVDERLRRDQTALQELRSRQNAGNKGKDWSQATYAETVEAQKLKRDIQSLADAIQREENARHALASELPNLPDPSVQDGATEADNIEVSRHDSLRRHAGLIFSDAGLVAPDHVAIGERLKMLEQSPKMSGARFSLLSGDLARLERALGQFMIDAAGQNGYREVSPPLVVHYDALFNTGQIPKFEEDLFHVGHGDHYLIPTAEVTLANMVADTIQSKEELPLRLAALTPCFRAEAGSAGRDTRGLIRQHQFYKVELVAITTPEQSADEHERMIIDAESVLKALDLSFRTVKLCVGDLGFSAAKTFDLEVWLPGQGAYREIASISNCQDFQARRMRARFKEGKSNRLVHTLNGSGVAVGRALVAVLEQYQNPDGSVTIPSVLQPYMGGMNKIEVAQCPT